jgi:hypothetical protein
MTKKRWARHTIALLLIAVLVLVSTADNRQVWAQS